MFEFIVEFIQVVEYIVYFHNFKENMHIKNAMFNMEIIAHLNYFKQGKSPLVKSFKHLSYQNEVSLEIVNEDFEFYFD